MSDWDVYGVGGSERGGGGAGDISTDSRKRKRNRIGTVGQGRSTS